MGSEQVDSSLSKNQVLISYLFIAICNDVTKKSCEQGLITKKHGNT